MKKIYSFTYYWNAQVDGQGRNVGFFMGYSEGDALQIAYRGFVELEFVCRDMETLESAAEFLWGIFNDSDRRPADYHGPSMSVSSVVEVQGVCYAAEPIGFKTATICKSEIHPGEASWNSQGVASPILR